jgi:hypothetical protein
MGTDITERYPGKLPEVLLGAVLIVLTTFVPVLNLINLFPFAGVILSGALATWIYIVRHQVPLSYRKAFVLGAQSGFVGSALIMFIIYLMLEKVRNLSMVEFQKLLSEWGGRLPSDSTELYRQVMMVINAPIEVKAVSYLLSLVLIALVLAPLSGLGARLTVYILKRQARKSDG